MVVGSWLSVAQTMSRACITPAREPSSCNPDASASLRFCMEARHGLHPLLAVVNPESLTWDPSADSQDDVENQ